MIFSRDQLYHRHRLSHQQIDEFLSENSSHENLAEKLQQMEMVREFLRVADSLNKAGISFIPMKGPVLSYRLYKDTTSRIYKDIDLLIDEKLMEKAVEILYNLGYEPCYHKWPTNNKNKQLFFWHRHHFNVWHPEKGLVLELHWKLFYFHYIKPDIMEQLISSNLTKLELAGHQFNIFNIEFELLFLITHGGQHDWKRLKWLVDIDKILKVYKLNEERFLQLTNIMKAGRMVALCNAMLQEYFPDAPLLPVQESAPPFLIKFALSQIKQKKGIEYDSIISFIKFYRAKMIAFPGLNYKLSVIKQLFFMPEDMDNERLPSSALLYYFVGPFNKIKRRLKRSHNRNV